MKRLFAIAAALFLAFSFLGAEDTKYTNDSIARLSHLTGSAFIQRASDLGYEECVLNTPITEGDRLGTTDGRAEVYFSRSNYIRLDENTKIDFLSLPKTGDDLVRIRVWSGNVYLDIGRLAKEKDVEIHTADTSFYFLDEGLYRVDVNENKETEMLVFRGLVEAAGEEGSILIKAGQRLEAAEGRFVSRPSQFVAASNDAFDRWNDSRNTDMSRKPDKRYLPAELEDFEYELSRNGQWMDLPPYGYVWVPSGMDADWRPYNYGRWIWLPLSGWTWLPHEPWGWATFHYGRWHWGIDFGWYWIPTSIWGPAWVDWWWDNNYFAWAPISWWGYPVVVIDGRFYGRHYGDFYPHNSRALTMIHKDQLKAKNISRIALRGDSLNGISRMALSSPRLTLRPTGSQNIVQPIEGRKVFIRNDGPVKLKGDSRIAGSEGLKPKSLAPRKADKDKTGTSESSGQTEERKIRKKNDSAALDSGLAGRGPSPLQGTGGGQDGVISRRTILGYPSSPSIDRERISRESGAPGRGFSINSIYKFFSGERYSSRRVSSKSDSRMSSSSISRSRGTSSSSSRSASSSRSSGSSSHSSGSVRKKNS